MSAKISINTDAVGTMDPFVVFEMIDDKKKVIWKDQTDPHVSGH